MIEAPSTALTSSPQIALPPSSRMLVDVEYLIEQLVLEAQAKTDAQIGGLPQRGSIVGEPLSARGGFGQHRRQMEFAHLRLFGLMRNYSAAYLVDALNAAFADPETDGILLEVNTGGGELTAANMIANVIEGRPKPVVTYAHFAASGGMMATKHSDEIVAAGQSARAGSIGVMMSLPKYLRRLYGDYVTDIYAETSPDKNKAWNEWILNGSTEGFRAELNALDEVFMAEMRAARPINPELADSTLAGGVWLAEEAKDRGLVDSIGTFQYAINRLASAVAATNQHEF